MIDASAAPAPAVATPANSRRAGCATPSAGPYSSSHFRIISTQTQGDIDPLRHDGSLVLSSTNASSTRAAGLFGATTATVRPLRERLGDDEALTEVCT